MNILTLIFGLELRKEVSTLRRKYDVTNVARNTTKKAEAVMSIIPAQPRNLASDGEDARRTRYEDVLINVRRCVIPSPHPKS
jgi:hypothetical protein